MITRSTDNQTTEDMIVYEQDRRMFVNANYGKIMQSDNQTTRPTENSNKPKGVCEHIRKAPYSRNTGV